ncbi:hypothetical protein NEFER03_2178 [Nematocida sp. LUAm3]|nr:hypothetical protein NEFER03_2178 [Nematocida sp. LUAm3]KAI5176286.1 hypothetical protein NEFER02_2078 [Nematocida sp. LUAm2]KAI5179242.1 hypothetical protein NEFER01_2096 [Nematocida sp. LUAm1]
MKEEKWNTLLTQQSTKKEEAKLFLQIQRANQKANELAKKLEEDSSTEASISFLFRKREAERLKRIERILKRERMRKEELLWLSGENIKTKHTEKFKILTEEYSKEFPLGPLLYKEPPSLLFIHAVAIEDCGVIRMGDSFVEAKKGSLYYARKQDIEHLLVTGLMKSLSKKNF